MFHHRDITENTKTVNSQEWRWITSHDIDRELTESGWKYKVDLSEVIGRPKDTLDRIRGLTAADTALSEHLFGDFVFLSQLPVKLGNLPKAFIYKGIPIRYSTQRETTAFLHSFDHHPLNVSWVDHPKAMNTMRHRTMVNKHTGLPHMRAFSIDNRMRDTGTFEIPCFRDRDGESLDMIKIHILNDLMSRYSGTVQYNLINVDNWPHTE